MANRASNKGSGATRAQRSIASICTHCCFQRRRSALRRQAPGMGFTCASASSFVATRMPQHCLCTLILGVSSQAGGCPRDLVADSNCKTRSLVLELCSSRDTGSTGRDQTARTKDVARTKAGLRGDAGRGGAQGAVAEVGEGTRRRGQWQSAGNDAAERATTPGCAVRRTTEPDREHLVQMYRCSCGWYVNDALLLQEPTKVKAAAGLPVVI